MCVGRGVFVSPKKKSQKSQRCDFCGKQLSSLAVFHPFVLEAITKQLHLGEGGERTSLPSKRQNSSEDTESEAFSS